MSSSNGLVPTSTSSSTQSASALETSPILGLVSPRGTQSIIDSGSQSPHNVLRRVSLQQLRYEPLGSSSALQFHIGAPGSSNPPVTPQTQSTRADDQHGQRQHHDRQHQQHFTVPTPAPMLTPLLPFVERDSDSDESDDSIVPRRTAASSRPSRRPPIARRRTPVVHSPTPVLHPSTPAARSSTLQTAAVAATDSEDDLPNLLDVSDSSDLGSADDRDEGDSMSDDDDDWTDDEEGEEPATVSGAYLNAPGTIPMLGADRRATLFPPFAPATPNAMPLDIWQALVGSMPTERPPDPERAKELMRGLEPVPEDLLDRWFMAAGDSADAICAICREDLNEMDETLQSDGSGLARLLALSCRHVFHSECLGPWLARRTTCPTCRFDLDPDSLTLRAPPAGAEAAAASERIAQLLAPLGRPTVDIGGPTTVDYAERLRQLFSEPFPPTPAEGEGTPVDSPLDVLAWQEALNQFVILGGGIEDRLRTYGAEMDAETRAEMEEERDVYRRTEALVRRGLAETRRMAETGEADDVLAYIERGGGVEDSEAEDESWDDDSGNEMPSLERITPAVPPAPNNDDDDELPPPLEPIPSTLSPSTFFTVTQPPPPTPQIAPAPPRNNFWRTWRREARVLFQALYDIGSTDTEEARGILGDLDERARIVAYAIVMPLPALPQPPPPPPVEDDTSLLVRVLRGETVGARERDSARRTDTRLFMQGLGAAAWGVVQVGPAELSVVEHVYESRRDALNVLTGQMSWASPVSEDRELAIFIRSLHDALSPNAPDRISIIEAARTAYLDRRRLHRNLIPPTPAIPTVAISPPTLLWPSLPDIPLAADNLLRQLVGPMLTATATTTPSSPAATLNIASPPLPSLVVPPGPMMLGSGAAGPASAVERRTWARPEGQTLLEWVEEREQVQTDGE